MDAATAWWSLAAQGSARAKGSQESIVISHIVLFNAKAGLSEADVRLFAQQLRRTMAEIPSVIRASVGRRVSIDSGNPRNLGDTTYEFSAVVDFEDKQGLITYLSHPLHQELGRLFWLYCASTVVLEVTSVDAKSADVVDLLVMKPNYAEL